MSKAALAPRAPSTGEMPDDDPAFELIELFFFAYRDFVGDADRLLAGYALGRAHHRVLHFVMRRPGLAVADLLDVLKITKQSLNRVLKELIGKGFVEQRTGTADRRQRLLHATPEGHALALSLARLQTRRIARALDHHAEAGAAAGARSPAGFLFAMIDPGERPKVTRILSEERKAG